MFCIFDSCDNEWDPKDGKWGTAMCPQCKLKWDIDTVAHRVQIAIFVPPVKVDEYFEYYRAHPEHYGV